MDISLFKQAGLTDGEIKVYLALLESGLSTTGPIVKRSGIAKSIVYPILEKLMQKGLVSYIIKDKTKYFQASEPGKILEYIDNNEDKLKEVRDKIKSILPELIMKQSASPKSEATIYLGFKGIRTAHEHLYNKLKRGEEYCYLGVPAYQPEEQHIYWMKDHIRREKEGINGRILFNKDTDKKIVKNRNSFKGSDARYMPSEIKTPACFMTFKDTTVIILQSPEEIAVEIVNQEITDSFQAYFEEFWKKSVPFKS